MSTEKVSLTLDDNLVQQARATVGTKSLSGYVNEALRRQLQRDRLIAFLDAADAQSGPISDELMEEVRHSWPERAARRKRSA
jgi:Arc/MetJ family transcription regulator